jgi:hypothetical protein
LPTARSKAIQQGVGATHLARVECVGEHLLFWVDGELLVEVRDGNLSEGDIGLGVASLDGEYWEVAFDNVVVTAP